VNALLPDLDTLEHVLDVRREPVAVLAELDQDIWQWAVEVCSFEEKVIQTSGQSLGLRVEDEADFVGLLGIDSMEMRQVPESLRELLLC